MKATTLLLLSPARTQAQTQLTSRIMTDMTPLTHTCQDASCIQSSLAVSCGGSEQAALPSLRPPHTQPLGRGASERCGRCGRGGTCNNKVCRMPHVACLAHFFASGILSLFHIFRLHAERNFLLFITLSVSLTLTHPVFLG